ncbi:MAG: methyltransferase domain-containing protein [Rhodospirillaceae bacterium]|jgi:SAM-dependent methyltransferase|nr:methyltransferase domain-containing protein [Rhodospirillaceae bacterium]MBT5944222.1 methyltransferase domain-containing protein [Rhodospirillaceae bacterium]MBT6403635.1 methyltransferase domain-containing protein [Rhodospirillaceae bacterium]MBT6536580.1 methyltransferase domain-containing protein [Rhodospirillaceae bacterium]MBT7360843.1 methyltransferase domain-containing protein [Rhodospirillaceae bacterium]
MVRPSDIDVTAQESPFKPEHFERQDTADDAAFYVPERMVQHLDEVGRAALTVFYRENLPAGGRILDLMSSWVSHLPAEIDYANVVGLGMNRAELDANPRLTDHHVQNLNAEPGLPFDDGAFDACVIALSVQYLTRPLDVFAEIARVLTPSGLCVVSFSNRCFPTKAVAIWQALGDSDHAGLVGVYFREAGGFEEPVGLDLSSSGVSGDPLFVVTAKRN